VIAAGDHRRRQRAALGTEHISGIQRVAEARQQGRLVEQLHADQGAALRQGELLDRIDTVQRQLLLRVRGVGRRVADRVMGIDQEHEASAEGMGRADQVAQVHGLADPFRPDAEIAAHRPVPTRLNHQRSRVSPLIITPLARFTNRSRPPGGSRRSDLRVEEESRRALEFGRSGTARASRAAPSGAERLASRAIKHIVTGRYSADVWSMVALLRMLRSERSIATDLERVPSTTAAL
jgi:hypothetical protein